MAQKFVHLTLNPKIQLLLIACLLLAHAHAQSHQWVRSNPGGGGAYSTVGAGPDGVILAGSDLGGASISFDGGQSWDIIGVPQGLKVTHVSGLGFDPTDPNVFFIGTEIGIFRSADKGNSVTHTNIQDGYVTDIEICPSNTNIGYASYHPVWNGLNGTILKTTDNGVTWSPAVAANQLPSNLRVLEVNIDPNNCNTVYFLSGQGRFACGPADIYKSTDGGVHWSMISPDNDEVADMAIDKVNPNRIYATTIKANCDSQYYWTSLDGKFYVSTDGGATWTHKGNHSGVIWPKAGAEGTVRLIDPREPWPWNDDAGTWKTTNSGDSWTHTGYVTNWETGHRTMGSQEDNLYNSYSSSFNGICKTLGEDLSQDRIYWVNYQWVFGSSDEGVTFQQLYTDSIPGHGWQSRGFDNITMMDISICQSNPNVIYAGYLDIGLWTSKDGGQSWSSCNEDSYTGDWGPYGGNTFTVLADPGRDNVVWASMQGYWDQNATLLRNTHGGKPGYWTPCTGLPTTTRIMGLSLDPNSNTNNRTLFVTAEGDVFKSTDDGQSWTKVYDDPNDGCRYTAVAPNNSNIVYAGGESGLVKSTDGGSTWTATGTSEMQGNGPFDVDEWQGVSAIKIDDQGRVFVAAFGEIDYKGLWVSDDGGSSWTKIKTDKYLRDFALVPGNPDAIYTASSSALTYGGYDPESKGVEYTTDGGQTWHPANDGMPFPFAVCMDVTPGPNPKIWVGSPGSGFQYASIPGSILPVDMETGLTAKRVGRAIRLHWVTGVETNLDYFLLQKSTDGVHWQVLSQIIPLEEHRYEVWDQGPFEGGIVYYRLLEVDRDGQQRQIGLATVLFRKERAPELYPNPVVDRVHITPDLHWSADRIHIAVSDALGRHYHLPRHGLSLDADRLAPGIYFLDITTPNGQYHLPFVKN